MRRRLVNLLLAAALLVAVIRLQTVLRAPPPQLPPAPAVEPAAPPADGAVEGQAEPPAGAGTEGYDAIVARDLFSASRGVVPPAPVPPAKPAPKPAVQPKLTLTGVVIIDGEKTAYLQEGAAETRPRKVREGDSFAGGTVKLIRPDGITFVFAGTEVVVALRTPKDLGPAPRPGEAPMPPQPPEVSPRRPLQPVAPGAVLPPGRPPQAIPGVPRVMPAPEEEQLPEEEFIDEGEYDPGLEEEEEVFDEGEIPPDEFEEQSP